MPIFVLCPHCSRRAEKLRLLSEVARGEVLYRCPSCRAVCSEPTVPIIGEPLKRQDQPDA